jgi:hypothetical protein
MGFSAPTGRRPPGWHIGPHSPRFPLWSVRGRRLPPSTSQANRWQLRSLKNPAVVVECFDSMNCGRLATKADAAGVRLTSAPAEAGGVYVPRHPCPPLSPPCLLEHGGEMEPLITGERPHRAHPLPLEKVLRIVLAVTGWWRLHRYRSQGGPAGRRLCRRQHTAPTPPFSPRCPGEPRRSWDPARVANPNGTPNDPRSHGRWQTKGPGGAFSGPWPTRPSRRREAEGVCGPSLGSSGSTVGGQMDRVSTRCQAVGEHRQGAAIGQRPRVPRSALLGNLAVASGREGPKTHHPRTVWPRVLPFAVSDAGALFRADETGHSRIAGDPR